MKSVLRKSNLVAGILILIVVCLGVVFAGDVIVQEGIGIFDKIGIGTTNPLEALDLASGNLTTTGTVESGKFQSTDCTATGLKAVAFGYGTAASGGYSTAMGLYSEASGNYSTAMGNRTTSGNYSTAMGSWTIASGAYSTAMGGGPVPPCTIASGNFSTAIGTIVEATGDYSTAIGAAVTAGPANYTTAIGKSFTNNVQQSFAVGFGQKDFAVSGGQANVYGDLDVTQKVTMGTLVLPASSSVPDSPVEGQIYLNTTDDKVKIYVNDEWKTVKWQ